LVYKFQSHFHKFGENLVMCRHSRLLKNKQCSHNAVWREYKSLISTERLHIPSIKSEVHGTPHMHMLSWCGA